MTFKVFYINLDRSTDRRITMERKFQACGVKAERISGVDGAKLVAELNWPKASIVKTILYNGRKLTPGEIGCMASHLKVAQAIIDQNLDWALVLEDDAEINPRLFSLLPELVRNTPTLDLISIATDNPRGTFYKVCDLQDIEILRLVGRRNVAAGHILRRSGALKLKKNVPISLAADLFHIIEFEYGVISGFCWPNLIRLPDELNENSVIDQLDLAIGISKMARYRSNIVWRKLVRPFVNAACWRVMRQNNRSIHGLRKVDIRVSK